MAVHTASDLRQMQSLPLEYKIRMTEERIRGWYESWWRYEIYDKATGKTRYATIDNRDYMTEPKMKETEYINSAIPGWVYVSFSGGKDSSVLLDIIRKMGLDDVPAVFCDTGLEYPEVRKFATERSDVNIRPEMSFDKVIKTYGYQVISKEVAQRIYYAKKGSHWAKMNIQGLDNKEEPNFWKERYKKWAPLVDAPFNVSHYCCDVMKKYPFRKYETESGRKKIVGTLAAESQLRRSQWYKFGCNAFGSKTARSAPMSFWTEQDVLLYIKENDLPIATVYGEVVPVDDQLTMDLFGEAHQKLKTTGCERTGCMFCMFGCHLEQEPNRFQRMKETHPRQYDYCMRPVEEKGLGLGKVLDYLGIPKE